MGDSRDFSNAADDTAAAFAHYALRSAGATTHALHLYEQVIDCVARRQVTPDGLHDSLTRFARAHAATSATNVSVAAARFVTGLAASTFLPTVDEDSAAAFEPTDVAGSMARADDHALRRNARAVETHFAQLAAIAASETPHAERRTAAKQMNRIIASELSRTAAVWFEFLAALDEERGRFAEQYLLSVLRTVNPIGFDTDVVELAGPINTTISTVVTLENTHSERATIRCAVSDVRRADGVGPAFLPNLELTPDVVMLERAHEASVRLSLWLDDAMYDARSPYVGMLHISRDDAPRLDVPLRITPTVNFHEGQRL